MGKKLTSTEDRRIQAATALAEWAKQYRAEIVYDDEDEINGPGLWIMFDDGMTKSIYVAFKEAGTLLYLHRGKFHQPVSNDTQRLRRTRRRHP